MAKSFFSDQECRDIGFSAPMIETLRKIANFLDLVSQLDATDDDLTTTAALLLLTEARVDDLETFEAAVEALQPFVRQDQTTAWTAATGTEARTALAAYAGQVVSNPPTQVEMQALDDAVKAISQHLVALINDLKGNGALS